MCSGQLNSNTIDYRKAWTDLILADPSDRAEM